jgi:hypothetical protein
MYFWKLAIRKEKLYNYKHLPVWTDLQLTKSKSFLSVPTLEWFLQ